MNTTTHAWLQYGGIGLFLALWVALLANLSFFQHQFGHSSMTIAMLLLVAFVFGLGAISIWGVHAPRHNGSPGDC